MILVRSVIFVFGILSLVICLYGREGFESLMHSLLNIFLFILIIIVVDGLIFVQIVAGIRIYRLYSKMAFKQFGLIVAIVDILIINALEWSGHLDSVMYIIGATVITASSIAFVACLIIYSVNTWFKYIE